MPLTWIRYNNSVNNTEVLYICITQQKSHQPFTHWLKCLTYFKWVEGLFIFGRFLSKTNTAVKIAHKICQDTPMRFILIQCDESDADLNYEALAKPLRV